MGLYAYVGRYAHQDVHTMGQMTVVELMELAEETAALLEQEQHNPEG